MLRDGEIGRVPGVVVPVVGEVGGGVLGRSGWAFGSLDCISVRFWSLLALSRVVGL